MRKSTAIELDVTKNIENGVKFYAKQFDDLKLKVKIFDGVEEVDVEGQEIVVCIVKEDKTVIEQKEDITVEDNTMIIDLSKQATTSIGKCSMEILLKDEEGVSSTSTVYYMVGEKLSTTIVEIIQSSDDIEVLNTIEEFIQNSNVDIVDIKESIKALEDSVNEAQNSINADFESIIAKIKELETSTLDNISSNADEVKERAIGEIGRVSNETIEKIEVAKDEVVTSANEAIEKANEAVEKAGETLETVNTVKAEVDKINDTVAEAISTIESTKDEAIDEIASSVVVIEESKEEAVSMITSAKNTAISSITDEKIASVNTINGLKENAINGIEVSRQGAVSSIEETKQGATSSIEAVKQSAVSEVEVAKQGAIGEVEGIGAIVVGDIKSEIAIEKNKIVEEAKSELNVYASTTTEEALDSIEDTKIVAVQNIEDTKTVAMQNIVETKTSAIQDVNNSKDTVLEEVKTSLDSEKDRIVAEASEGLNTVKETAIKEINSAKDGVVEEVKAGVDTVKADAIKEINTTKENVLQSFGSELETKKGAAIEGFDTDLSSKKDSAIASAKVELDNAKSVTVKAIEEVKSDAMDKLQQQGNGISSDLTTLKGKVVEEINTVKGNNIEEITAKLNEVKSELDALVLVKDEVLSANSTGEVTLSNLLDAIKRAEEITSEVEAYIESKSGNHDEIMAEIEAIKLSIEELNGVTKYIPAYNGVIGDSSYPAVFATCPVPEDKEIIGEIDAFDMYSKRYVKVYVHEMHSTSPDALKVISGTTFSLSFSTSTVGSFTAYYKTETSNWTLNAYTSINCNFNTKDAEVAKSHIYKNTLPLTNGTITFEVKEGESDVISSYNVINAGTYKVSHKSRIEGAIKDACEGVLTVSKAGDRIVQMLVEKTGKVSTRYCEDDSWSVWSGADNVGDISYAIKTEFAEKNEYYPYWRVVPAQPAEYPFRLIISMGTVYGRIIYSKQDLSNYLKYDKATKKLVWQEGYESVEMLHYYVSNISSNASTSTGVISWSSTTSASQYMTSVVKDWYSHNFDILDTEGNVYRKSEEFDTSNVVVDFNIATEKSKYNVDINVDEDIANKPENTRLKGFLMVDKCGAMTKQELITVDNNVYRRIATGATWTEWKSI